MNPQQPGSPPSQSPRHLALWFLFLFAVFGFVLIFSGQCSLDRFTAHAYPARSLPDEPDPQLLPPPPLSEDYWPCGDCHEEGEDIERRPHELEEHDFELRHGNLWCLDCHNVRRHDLLQVSEDQLVPIAESWKLCTRCHGEKLAEWRAGVHGKRTGHWRGSKEYRTCVECHRPHAPAYGQLEPMPRPLRAEEIRPRLRELRSEEVSDDAG